MGNNLHSLMKQLGHAFSDKALLDVALRHRSSGRPNNERLEFLGDALVNFIIGEVLYHQYPKATEGELSRMRAVLVDRESLAEIAQSLDLGPYLRLGPGELKSGGHRRASILADAVEAIIGALYLDAGLQTCRDTVLAWYADRLKMMTKQASYKDPKTQLQEYLQAHQLPLPEYAVTSIEGQAHKQTFYVQCKVEGLPIVSTGQATSRRKAEQEAAQQFLTQLKKTNREKGK